MASLVMKIVALQLARLVSACYLSVFCALIFVFVNLMGSIRSSSGVRTRSTNSAFLDAANLVKAMPYQDFLVAFTVALKNVSFTVFWMTQTIVNYFQTGKEPVVGL